MKMSKCYINHRPCEEHLRRLPQKKSQNHDRTQQAISCSRDESGERANVARLYLATIQNNNKCIKSNLMLCKCTAVGKKDDVAQVEKTPACWESRVSKKSVLQFRGCAIITWRGGGGFGKG